MALELADSEKQVVRHALETDLSDLRQEIVKTEKHEWRVGLHGEEEVLTKVIAILATE